MLSAMSGAQVPFIFYYFTMYDATFQHMHSDFVTSVSCVPDPNKSPKTQNNLWYARSIDRFEDVFVKYPVCVISVTVLVAIVKRCLFLLVFVVLYNRRSIFSLQ